MAAEDCLGPGMAQEVGCLLCYGGRSSLLVWVRPYVVEL